MRESQRNKVRNAASAFQMFRHAMPGGQAVGMSAVCASMACQFYPSYTTAGFCVVPRRRSFAKKTGTWNCNFWMQWRCEIQIKTCRFFFFCEEFHIKAWSRSRHNKNTNSIRHASFHLNQWEQRALLQGVAMENESLKVSWNSPFCEFHFAGFLSIKDCSNILK